METHSTQSSFVQKLVTAILLAVAFFLSAGTVVFLSLRGKEVKVPDLIGKTEGDAGKILENEGLRLKVKNRTTDEKIQANLIAEQLPPNGTTVKAGQVVSVTISTGIEAKKEEPKATPKPSPSATAKPKPKPSPSASPQDEKSNDSASSSSTPGKASKEDAGKAKESKQSTGEGVKGKPATSPIAKTSPKPSVKPSPKKPANN